MLPIDVLVLDLHHVCGSSHHHPIVSVVPATIVVPSASRPAVFDGALTKPPQGRWMKRWMRCVRRQARAMADVEAVTCSPKSATRIV